VGCCRVAAMIKRLSLPAMLSLLVVLILAAPAGARPTFHARIGRALGLVPIVGSPDIAQGTPIPAVYHGGPVMNGGVTVHTIFWAPPGYSFTGSPGGSALGYEALVEKFFTDVAHDSGTTTNAFSVLNQYGSDTGPGTYSIAYNPALASQGGDVVIDTDPYPAQSEQCASPNGEDACITDQELSDEVDKVIGETDPTGRGLHNVWEVLLPQNVDECISAGSCGSNAFAGYHSFADAGHGTFIYAVLIDTDIETIIQPGADPEGNPEAESTIDTAAHETIEAMTDPEGDGWMDPNGNEVADKCENGLQEGTPLGFAADGSPYDQLINGDQWLFQEMWSDVKQGCVQSSTATSDGLPLPSVHLTQFSPSVSGNDGEALGGLGVEVILQRAGETVGLATTRTRADGSWGPVTLRSPRGNHPTHALGDDRDLIAVGYGGPKAPTPELIATGSGGSPFDEAGWTGWLALDAGYDLTNNSITVGPCFQTGVLGISVNGTSTPVPVPECATETDQATVSTPRVSRASRVTMSSDDNRASSELDPLGALVNMTIPLGEPGSVSAGGNEDVFFEPSGMPSCTADLEAQTVSCNGLVPGARYTIVRSRRHASRTAKADGTGTVTIKDLPGTVKIAGGDLLTLKNSARRVLTVLHVAHLRVGLVNDDADTISSGTCQPGDYFGAPLTLATLPASPSIGVGGAAGTGTVCPSNGQAAGMSSATIAQTDDFSGGLTQTEVPLLEYTAPAPDAILSGAFRALAQTVLPDASGALVPAKAKVSLTVTKGASHHVLFRAANVALTNGAPVPKLAAGVYSAKWVVTDANRDTRTLSTKFIVQ
jgi:hypothetical protein